MSDAKPTTVDEYISHYSPEVQQRLQTIRATIKQLTPTANEIISYSMPAYKIPGTKGYPAIYLAAHTNHIGMYPLPKDRPQKFAEQLAKYQTGKGTVRFVNSQPLPMDFIKQFITLRVQETQPKA